MHPSLSPTRRAGRQQAARLDHLADHPAVASASCAAPAAAQPTTPASTAHPCRVRSASAPAPVAHASTAETTDRPSRTANTPVDRVEKEEGEEEEEEEEGDAHGGPDSADPSEAIRTAPPNAATAARRRSPSRGGHAVPSRTRTAPPVYASLSSWPAAHTFRAVSLPDLPNEVLLHILGFLDVNDLLSASRTSRHLRCLCRAPILHILRRRRIRAVLAPLIAPQHRPSLADLMARSIFLTHTTVVSRKLGRSLATIRLARRLAARPPAQVLVERCVLPPECAPGIGHVAPALAARTRAIERQRVKDGLRQWVGAVWQREVGRRSESIRRREERVGIGKVWRLRRFWERISRGDAA